MAEYPSWVYDPTGVNPPMLVTTDDQFVALLTGPVPDPSQVSTNPTASVKAAVNVASVGVLGKANGVTVAPSLSVARFGKNPSQRSH